MINLLDINDKILVFFVLIINFKILEGVVVFKSFVIDGVID